LNMIFLGLVMPLISFLLPLSQFWKTKNKFLNETLVEINLLLFLLMINYPFMNYIKWIKPKMHISYQQSDNTNAQLWLRENSDFNSTILAPFYIGGFTEPDFRTISERSNVLTNGELVETILNTSQILTTKNKINDLTGQSYNFLTKEDRLFDYYVERELYHNTISHNLAELKNKYGINFVVVESDFSLKSTKLVYSNGRYKIYQL
jgi:hypothetical protein